MAWMNDLPRYCGECGEIFHGRTSACPQCRAPWPASLPQDRTAAYAVLLSEIHDLWRGGRLSEDAYRQLRRIYEERLQRARPPRPAQAPAAAAAMEPLPTPAPSAAPQPAGAAAASARPAAAIPARPATPRPPSPPRAPAPPREPRIDLRNWAARRQADLVLYLGAFLLTVSALIFSSYQGGGLSGMAKSGLFGAYTLIFLVMGMQLRRWSRVQEAGPVFLALGAILTPLNFVALYTNVLEKEDVGQEWVWLAGSSATAALYYLLAWRGYGRFYAIPGGVAAFLAYASLAACLDLPAEWYGAWFLALAVVAAAVAQRLPRRPRLWLEAGALTLGAPALGFSHLAAIAESTSSLELGVSYAFVSAGLLRLALPSRRPAYLALLPVATVMTAASLLWANEPWSAGVTAWVPLWMMAMAAGYLVAARIRPDLAALWTTLTFNFAVLALLMTHGLVIGEDRPERLPAVYGAATLLAMAVYQERRYAAALGFVPPLVMGTAATSLWAADRLAFEWLGAFVAAASFGYAVLARWRPAPESAAWRSLAAVSAALAAGYAHVAASQPGIDRWELASTYGIVAFAAAFDALRFRLSGAAVPLLAGAGGAAALWAFDVEFAWWAYPALGAGIAVASGEFLWRRDAVLARAGWPVALVLAASPVPLVGVHLDEPWHGTAAFLLAALVVFWQAFRTNGALGALAGASRSASAVRIERQMLARAGGWELFAAAGFAMRALELTPAEGAWIFAGVAAALFVAVPLLRGRLGSFEEVAGPVGVSAAIIAAVIAHPAYDQQALMLGMVAVAASLATGGRYAMAWRGVYGVAAVFTLAAGHNQADVEGTAAWELPAAYGYLLVALLWDSAWNRFQPAMLFVPAAAAAGSQVFAWWREWPHEHWAWAPLGMALLIAASDRLWLRGAVVGRGGWPYVLVLGLAPLPFLASYDAEPAAGAGAFAAGALAWTVAAWRSRGALAGLLEVRTQQAVLGERMLVAFGAYALALGGTAHASLALELDRLEAAWVFVVIGAAAFTLSAVPLKQLASWVDWLTVAGATAAAVGFGASGLEFGHLSGMAAAVSAPLLAAGLVRRSNGRTIVAGIGAFVSMAFLWEARDWQLWTLALTWAGISVALYAGLLPFRLRPPQPLYLAMNIYAAAPIFAALGAALQAMSERTDLLAAGEELVTTNEWAVWVVTIAAGGAMLLAEGLLQRVRAASVAGTAILLLALELGIAIAQPTNVQAYTMPIALYLVGLGLATRQSSEFFGHNMYLHETLFVIGAAFLILPPAEQSFEPGGGAWGLLIIGEGLALLAAGLTLFQRWLAVGGVVTLVGVAGRFIYERSSAGDIPYWLTFGAIGLLLLAVGVLMLLERDWWDRAKSRLAHWWLESESGHGAAPHAL